MVPKKPPLKLVESSTPEALPAVSEAIDAPIVDTVTEKGLHIDLAEVRATNGYLHVSYRISAPEGSDYDDNAIQSAIRFIAESFQQKLVK